MSIGLSVAHCDWDGYRVNLIDAPGFQDFAGEVVEALAVADAAVLVVAATGSSAGRRRDGLGDDPGGRRARA